HLVSSATNAATANLDKRLHVLDRRGEDLDRVLVRHLLLDHIQRRIEHILRDALFATVHQTVDELGGEQRLEFRIRTERRGTSGNLAHETSKVLGLFRSVAAARLFAIGDAKRIADAADDLIAHALQIANATTENE